MSFTELMDHARQIEGLARYAAEKAPEKDRFDLLPGTNPEEQYHIDNIQRLYRR